MCQLKQCATLKTHWSVQHNNYRSMEKLLHCIDCKQKFITVSCKKENLTNMLLNIFN